MRILLVCTLAISAHGLSGCISNSDMSDPITDTMAQTPFMYKADVQQGNVITQEQVNKLEPGMNKTQVRYIMGTPMLVDTFHQDRWDYIYTLKKGGRVQEKKRVSLLFKDDLLVNVEGDLRPEPGAETIEKETIVTVPDNKERTGILSGALQAVGLQDDGMPKRKKDAPAKETTGKDAAKQEKELPEDAAPEKAASGAKQTPAE